MDQNPYENADSTLKSTRAKGVALGCAAAMVLALIAFCTLCIAVGECIDTGFNCVSCSGPNDERMIKEREELEYRRRFWGWKYWGWMIQEPSRQAEEFQKSN